MSEKSDWEQVLDRFIDLLKQFDQEHPGRWYAYYLDTVMPVGERAKLAALLQQAVEFPDVESPDRAPKC